VRVSKIIAILFAFCISLYIYVHICGGRCSSYGYGKQSILIQICSLIGLEENPRHARALVFG
jgi:hypothetical protein